MLPEHTKNVDDGAFSSVKKKMRRANVRNSKDMMELINYTSKSIVEL